MLHHLMNPFNRSDCSTNVCRCAEVKQRVCVHWEGGARLHGQLDKPEIKLLLLQGFGVGEGSV